MAHPPQTAFLAIRSCRRWRTISGQGTTAIPSSLTFGSITLAIFLSITGCSSKPELDATVEEVAPREEQVQNLAATAEDTTKPSTQESATKQSTSQLEPPAEEHVADGGDAVANFEAGIAAYQANDLQLAFRKFQAAAEQGHADSQFNLALMYERGIGVAKDETKAVSWYDHSASQGNSAAQFNLGVLYENGRGTPVDFEKANQWYRKASVQGDPLAIGNLGMLYLRGQGVEQNTVAAVALLIVSASMDPSPDNHARQNLSKTPGLTPDIIATAQTLAGKLMDAGNLLEPLDEFLKTS